MLKKIDQYIIGKFLRTFFFTVLIFTMISVVIDFAEKVEKFIEEPITTYEIVFGYYPNFVLNIIGILWPLFTLIAVIFFTSRMAYSSEIISIFNAGVSFRRLMYPYFVGALIISLLHLGGNHYLIPEGNKTRLDLTYKYLHKNDDKGKTQDVHLFLSPDTKVFIHNFYKLQSRANKFRLEQFKDHQLVYLLKANTAKWIEEEQKWKLINYEIRTFDERGESLLVGNGKEIDTTLNLTPQDFVDYKEQHTMMTTPELKEYINYLNSRGAGNTKKYESELYRRTAAAFTNFILTVIGLAIAARKVRGGRGVQLALGMGLCAIFMFLSQFSIVFAMGNIFPPFFGIWMPNIVFSLIAVYLVMKAQK